MGGFRGCIHRYAGMCTQVQDDMYVVSRTTCAVAEQVFGTLRGMLGLVNVNHLP